MANSDWGARGRPRSIRVLCDRWRSELADECYAIVATRGTQPVHDIAEDMGVDSGALRRVIEMERPKRLNLFKEWAWIHELKKFAWCCELHISTRPPPAMVKKRKGFITQR